MSRILRVVTVSVIVVMCFAMVLVLFAGHIVKGAINGAGAQILGVPITVKDVNVGLFRGRFGLTGLVIGNPEGFKTPSAISLGKVAVDVNMMTLFSKVLVINSIYVDAPEITYEIGLHGSNIGAIQDKLGAGAEKVQEKPASSQKKVQINDFLVKGGWIHVSAVGLGGHAVAIPLPPVHLTDIGKESGGASVKEVIARLFGAIGDGVKGAASGIGKGVDAVGDGAKSAAKAIGAGAGKALESVGGLFKK